MVIYVSSFEFNYIVISMDFSLGHWLSNNDMEIYY